MNQKNSTENMQFPEKLVSLTQQDIEKIKKKVSPIKTALLFFTFIFLIFVAIVVFNLPYLMVIIGVSIFPAITLAFFLYVHFITKRNIKSGRLQLISGKIENKTTEEGLMNTGRQIQSQMDVQTYYYIYVNRKKIEVDEDDYLRLKIGESVEIKMTLYSQMVISLNKDPM
jgi:hypothetical protein